MCRELAALNAVGGTEHAQWILLSSVSEHEEFMCREPASGESCDIILLFINYRISSKNSALLIIRHPLPNIVYNFSAKVVKCICYKREWNADAERMLNINL